MIEFGKRTTVDKIHNGKRVSTQTFEEESLSIQDRPELIKELLVCADAVLNEGVDVNIKLEPAVNGTYLLRLVKTKEVK